MGGLLTVWEYRRYSHLLLARLLWMVAAFGILYALAEWGSLFVPNQERYLAPTITDWLWLPRGVLTDVSRYPPIRAYSSVGDHRWPRPRGDGAMLSGQPKAHDAYQRC